MPCSPIKPFAVTEMTFQEVFSHKGATRFVKMLWVCGAEGSKQSKPNGEIPLLLPPSDLERSQVLCHNSGLALCFSLWARSSQNSSLDNNKALNKGGYGDVMACPARQ